MPRLWSVLDFSKSKKPMSLSVVRYYLKLAKGKVTRTTLDRFGHNPEKVPRYIATRCKNLQEMVVPAGFLSASVLEAASCAMNLKIIVLSSQCHTTMDTVIQLLSKCHSLERAEFHSVKSSSQTPALYVQDWLTSLTLGSRMALNSAARILDINDLLEKIPNVQNLSLTNWFFPPSRKDPMGSTPDFSVLEKLQNLDISGLESFKVPRFPPSLRSLDMSKCIFTGDFTRDNTWMSNGLTQLVRLAIAHMIAKAPADAVILLLRNKGYLTHLDASGCLLHHHIEELVRGGYLDQIEVCIISGVSYPILACNMSRTDVLWEKVGPFACFLLSRLIS